jgi:hypothetical protein
MVIESVTVEDQPLKPDEFLSLSANSFPSPFRIKLGNGVDTLFVAGNSRGEVIVSQQPLASNQSDEKSLATN